MYLALMVGNCYLPLSLHTNVWFQRFMRVSNAKWVQVSRATLTKKYLPQCAGLIRTYVLNQLRGKSPCIVIDEMSKMGRSYYNVLLTSLTKNVGGKNIIEAYFLDCLCLEKGNAEAIGTAIGNIVIALKKEGIMVSAYASDNCAVMVAAIETATAISGVQMKRVACSSHAVNNILKSFMMQRPIEKIWTKVSSTSKRNKKVNAANKLVMNRSVLRKRFYELQKEHPLKKIEWREDWSCSFFRR